MKRVTASGQIRYFNEKNLLHREDGPAVEEVSEYKIWYINGNRHRIDGPAVEWANGTKFWYINNKRLTEEEHKRLTTRLGNILYL